MTITSITAPPRSTARGVLAVAHRGASSLAPENTLAAVRLAVELGADLVEVDVRRTRDGALVVLHDQTLSRTTDAEVRLPDRTPWRVEDLTLAELRGLDAGSWFSPAYAEERVPTLQEVLDAVRDTETGLLVELKEPTAAPGMVGALAALLPADAATAGVLVQSFDAPAMRVLKELRPDLPVGVLGRPRGRQLREIASWAQMVNPPHRRIDSAYVDLLHSLGLQSLVWTVDRPAAIRRMLRSGVDGVISNQVGQLRRMVPREDATRRRAAS